MQVLFRTGGVAAVACGAAMLAACQASKPPALRPGPLIQSANTCADFTQTIYFEAGGAEVTAPAERILNLAAARTRRCAVTGVAVVGLADFRGDPSANLALSQRRADAVKTALHRHGFDKVDIRTEAAGDTGAQTMSGQTRPVRRRADITFHVAPAAP